MLRLGPQVVLQEAGLGPLAAPSSQNS
jgi:hypothetical protein